MARVAGVAVVLAAVLASASAARPPRVPGAARAGVAPAGAAPAGAAGASLARARPKHVVLIVADDLGWSDLGFRNKQQIRTPTLDGLAARGAVLTQYYTPNVCSPARASLLTGRGPALHGVDDIVWPFESTGLPLDEVTLAETMSAKFSTHAVGKWHLGFHRAAYTPTFRGFQSFLGYYAGGEDYFHHSGGGGYDFHRDMGAKCGHGCSENAVEAYGNYSTHVFTDEALRVIDTYAAAAEVSGSDTQEPKGLFLYLAYQAVHSPAQCPDSYVKPYAKSIKDDERRFFAGMISAMDEGVANVTGALEKHAMLNETLVIFISDNGGPTNQHPKTDAIGSTNFPLRGGKHAIWEGGTRATAIVSGAGVPAQGNYTNLMYVTDLYPTILDAVQVTPLPSQPPLSGSSHWPLLSAPDEHKGNAGPRDEIYYGHPVPGTPAKPVDMRNGSSALRLDDPVNNRKWKLVNGTGGDPSDWWPLVTDEKPKPKPGASSGVSSAGKLHLFDLVSDPEERNDVASLNPRVVADLGARLQRALATERPTSANEPACKALQKAGAFFVNETRVPEGKAWTTWCDNATDYAENGTAAQ